MMNLDVHENELLESVERGEWSPPAFPQAIGCTDGFDTRGVRHVGPTL
jgi:hypothetical protein